VNGVVTLTPAPVLDRTYVVDHLHGGTVNRAFEVLEYMSGKGLNVARALHLAGRPVAAILPIGKEDEHLLLHTPHPEILRVVPIGGRVRVNTTIIERGGRTTNVNQTAVPISSADWELTRDVTLQRIRDLGAEWLVVSGKHPRVIETGFPIDLTSLFTHAREMGARVAVDTSGPELEHWARSPLVSLIKPNADELSSLVGRHITTLGDALDAGRELCADGIEIALVSLGEAGALGITMNEAHWAFAKATTVINTTGAGDATLAGFLSQSRGKENGLGGVPSGVDIPTALRAAVSWGALAVALPTTLIPSLDDAPFATVSAPDRDHVVTANEGTRKNGA
jgi:1-phosphofructokinase